MTKKNEPEDRSIRALNSISAVTSVILLFLAVGFQYWLTFCVISATLYLLVLQKKKSRKTEIEANKNELERRTAIVEGLREKHNAKLKDEKIRAAKLAEKRKFDLEAEATRAREAHRDADTQTSPFVYEIGRHANETLALRYGIANLKRGQVDFIGSDKIRLQKLGKIPVETSPYKRRSDLYRVKLSDFRDREALAVIEPGTEYVKTFYPLEESWFERHSALESALKGNQTMNLKEIAHFHIEKTVFPK